LVWLAGQRTAQCLDRVRRVASTQGDQAKQLPRRVVFGVLSNQFNA
jgi:hypothetical protein